MYFGWDYQGFVVQEDSIQTIEHHLFHALTKACLIESRESCQYHRCGRTDKGVSAFGQVISLSLRSKHPVEKQDLPESITTEMQYSKILNRLLPKDIRVVAWMPIPKELPEYSARFDCIKRTYKFYFPRSSLDLDAMRRACAHLIGSHDFRHLCKMDVGNGVLTFTRHVLSADIVAVVERDTDLATSMYSLVIEGNAFLWHQIRCIMGVLLLVGQGKESPDIIRELLDVEKLSRKPQYHMASDVPLNLFHCSYDLEDTNKWIYDKDDFKTVISHLQGEWTMFNVKSTMLNDALQQLEAKYAEVMSETQNADSGESERNKVMAHTDCLTQGVRSKVYTPLLKRETCSSLQERIEHYKKKRKIDSSQKLL
ncbi:hypothetical protein O3G_MSEX003051 [Manduca sexta]|nr:hypothetical protein O3G_MSEX003051 [Manduca sexta]